MIYRSKDKRKRRSQYFPLILSGLFLLSLIVIILFLANPTAGVVQAIGRPFWLLKTAVSESSFFSTFHSKAALSEENKALKQRVDQLKVDEAEKNALLNENISLKEILSRKEIDSKLVLATIINRPSASTYDNFVLDIGSNDGIEEGDLAFALGNLAVGKVIEVHPNSSLVRLFSSPGEKSQVLVVGTTTTAAATIGRGAGNFLISVPAGTEINIGDTVILSDLKPIILGTIEKIDIIPDASFISIYFKAPVNVSDLKYLQIETR